MVDDVEAVVLTGGAGRRMGREKSGISINGAPIVQGIVSAFQKINLPVTILGRSPIPGCGFVADQSDFAGPAVALSHFEPKAKTVFVCSCDLPFFRAECVGPLLYALGDKEAALPVLDGYSQPLCAAYATRVFGEWRALVESSDARSMKELVRVLDCVFLDEQWLLDEGLDPTWFKGINTPEELAQAMEKNDA